MELILAIYFIQTICPQSCYFNRRWMQKHSGTLHVFFSVFSKSRVHFDMCASLPRDTQWAVVVWWCSAKAKLFWDPGILQSSTWRKPKTPHIERDLPELCPSLPNPVSGVAWKFAFFKQLNIAGCFAWYIWNHLLLFECEMSPSARVSEHWIPSWWQCFWRLWKI